LLKPLKQSRLLECLVGLATGQEELRHGALPGAAVSPAELPRGVRILLAEDNPVNQKVALRQLDKLGFAADAVASGKEVLEALERIPYDVVLMDCHMPEMDGYEAAREIKRRIGDPALMAALKAKPYLIAITANALQGDREKCLAAGMDDYVQKPLELAELVAALGRAGVSLRPMSMPQPATVAPGSDLLDHSVLNRLRELRQPGEPDPVVELIDLFLQDMPKHTQKMAEAYSRQDALTLKVAAHSLKGSAKNMGAQRLAQLCADLEMLAKDGNLADAPPLLEAINKEYTIVQQALEAERGK
jgi:CheY-like chemotaxis protein